MVPSTIKQKGTQPRFEPCDSDNSLMVGHHERVISSKHPMCGGCCGQTVVYVSIQKYVCKHTFFLWQEQASKQPYIYERSLWLLCAKAGAVADGWWRGDADLNFKWTCLLWPRTSNTYKTKQNCIPQVLTSSNCIYLEGSKSCKAIWMAQTLCCLSTSNGFWHISPKLSGMTLDFLWLWKNLSFWPSSCTFKEKV